LQQDWAALRAARHGERAAGADVAAGVVGAADLRGVGEDAAGLVEHQDVVVPAVPEGAAGLQHLVAAVVAFGFGWDPVEAVVQRLHVGGGGYDVPAGAALGEQVLRGEGAGEVVGGLEGGREGGAEAEVAGDAGHERKDRHGVEVGDLAAEAEVGVVAAAMDVGQAEGVGKEPGVEAGVFQHAGEVFVAFGLEHVVEAGGRVAPAARVVGGGAGLEIGDQVHLALRVGHGAFRTVSDNHAVRMA
jgi:hypothetical protein